MKHCWLVAIALFSSFPLFAQFHDSATTLSFYMLDGDNITPGNRKIYAVNFDGLKGTMIFTSGGHDSFRVLSSVRADLDKDIHAYDEKVYEVDYNIEYSSSRSNSSCVVYVGGNKEPQYSQWTNSWYQTKYYYSFSRDRKKMTFHFEEMDGKKGNYETYTLVTKESLVSRTGERRQRTN